MRTEELPEVRNLPLFRSIRSVHLCRQLLRECRLEVVNERKSLFKAGDRPAHLHVMLDGYAKLTLSRGNDGPVMEVLGPQSIFIMAASVLDEPHYTSAEMLTPSRIVFVPAATLRSTMQSDHGLALFLLNQMSTSLRNFIVALGDRKSQSADERVERHYAGHLGPITGSILKKKDAASLLDITPQTFARISKSRS